MSLLKNNKAGYQLNLNTSSISGISNVRTVVFGIEWLRTGGTVRQKQVPRPGPKPRTHGSSFVAGADCEPG